MGSGTVCGEIHKIRVGVRGREKRERCRKGRGLDFDPGGYGSQ